MAQTRTQQFRDCMTHVATSAQEVVNLSIRGLKEVSKWGLGNQFVVIRFKDYVVLEDIIEILPTDMMCKQVEDHQDPRYCISVYDYQRFSEDQSYRIGEKEYLFPTAMRIPGPDQYLTNLERFFKARSNSISPAWVETALRFVKTLKAMTLKSHGLDTTQVDRNLQDVISSLAGRNHILTMPDDRFKQLVRALLAYGPKGYQYFDQKDVGLV